MFVMKGCRFKSMFFTLSKWVDKMAERIILELDIVGEGDGIIYSQPNTHLKGLSLLINDV